MSHDKQIVEIKKEFLKQNPKPFMTVVKGVTDKMMMALIFKVWIKTLAYRLRLAADGTPRELICIEHITNDRDTKSSLLSILDSGSNVCNILPCDSINTNPKTRVSDRDRNLVSGSPADRKVETKVEVTAADSALTAAERAFAQGKALVTDIHNLFSKVRGPYPPPEIVGKIIQVRIVCLVFCT